MLAWRTRARAHRQAPQAEETPVCGQGERKSLQLEHVTGGLVNHGKVCCVLFFRQRKTSKLSSNLQFYETTSFCEENEFEEEVRMEARKPSGG